MITGAAFKRCSGGVPVDLFYGFFLIILLAAEFCVIVRLKSEKKKIGYRKAVIGFGLVILLTLAVLIFDLKLSYLLIVLAAVSLFLDSYVGYYLDYYIKSKILDMQFISGIGRSDKEDAIIRGIIGLAHTLNLKVIAEGVETDLQLNFLKERQCDEIQGYYFSRPVPPEELEKMLRVSE